LTPEADESADEKGILARVVYCLTGQVPTGWRPPEHRLEAPYAKNRRWVEQPISLALAARLRRFLAGKPLGESEIKCLA